MVSSKTLNAHLKTVRGIVVKNFAIIDLKLEEMNQCMKRIEVNQKKSVPGDSITYTET